MTGLRTRTAARIARAVAWCAGSIAVLLVPPAVAASAAPATASTASIVVRWIVDPAASDRPTLEVSGLTAAELTPLRDPAWTPGQWQSLLAVYAEAEGAKPEFELPPMLGRYRVGPATIVFEPQFPLAPGVVYRAVFYPTRLAGRNPARGEPIIAVYQLPARPAGPGTVVSEIYPSADVLPENLLKFYLHFSAPMSGGHVYQHIHLQDAAGRDVALPFLELEQELWDPPMERLTLLLDPGRIKRGVRPLEEIGSSLQPGRNYTLVIDRDWPDANGQPLRESHRKEFRVGPADREPPNPRQWKIQPPAAGTKAPLTVIFSKPMDHALALRLLQVAGAGAPVEGTVALAGQEQRWIFTPAATWSRGPYRLIVATTIEDLAGNNIGKPFDVDIFENVQRSLASETVELPFAVR